MSFSAFSRFFGIPVSLLTLSLSLSAVEGTTEKQSPNSAFYGFTVKNIDGKPVSLSDFKGKVVLVVNTASRCGYTPQYEGLEALYKKYKDKGFVILGFPSNDFLGQEPGTNEEIKKFCTLNYDVSFPMFSKIDVNGKSADPLYKWLTGKDTNPSFGGPITWNFNKFLISADGTIKARFDSKVTPSSAELTSALEAVLKSKQ